MSFIKIVSVLNALLLACTLIPQTIYAQPVVGKSPITLGEIRFIFPGEKLPGGESNFVTGPNHAAFGNNLEGNAPLFRRPGLALAGGLVAAVGTALTIAGLGNSGDSGTQMGVGGLIGLTTGVVMIAMAL